MHPGLKADDTKDQGAKVSLKKQPSKKPSPPATAQKIVAASKLKTQQPAAALQTKKPAAPVTKPSPAVKTQKAATASKIQQPAAAPKTKKPAAPVIKSSPAVKTQKAKTASKTQKPTAAPKTKKTLTPPIKPLPYTIQVSAYRDPQISNQVARKLITRGDPAFTSPVDLSEKGKMVSGLYRKLYHPGRGKDCCSRS